MVCPDPLVQTRVQNTFINNSTHFEFLDFFLLQNEAIYELKVADET